MFVKFQDIEVAVVVFGYAVPLKYRVQFTDSDDVREIVVELAEVVAFFPDHAVQDSDGDVVSNSSQRCVVDAVLLTVSLQDARSV